MCLFPFVVMIVTGPVIATDDQIRGVQLRQMDSGWGDLQLCGAESLNTEALEQEGSVLIVINSFSLIIDLFELG